MISSPLLLVGVVTGAAALAFWLDRRIPLLSKVGASLLAILFGALLSNFGVVTPESPVYDAVGGPVTSLAIAWLLLAVNLRDLRRAGPRMLGAFGLAVVGTAAGAFLGALVFAGTFGGETWKLAGTLTGTYSGGSVNFVAVGRGVELPDALFAGATAADNLTTGLWLGVTLMLPIWLRRFYPTPVPSGADAGDEVGHPFFETAPLSTLSLAGLLALGLGLVVASEWVGTLIPAVPAVLWLTTFALVLGHVGPVAEADGTLQLGNLALHFFFVIIGIHSRIAEIVAVGIEVFWYTLLVVGLQGLVVFGVGRLLRIDVGTLAVSSQAAVGGPSSALAVAVAREWRSLVLPGIIVGLLGYALGNYAGFALAGAVRALGIGL
ncbi:MAG: DUF819 family protein [Gemmatimonadetes bacterium]|nr:DUF819 family protein [Gemmatimonadota bacterium]NIR78140.1 DUF819 family protein [Gemmatimonadota bacterium]NIT86701.1 DUF819 family protein [Gemmatimonadota bacterium]NIU30560.1 DUF819 family protein [Gemmatimonadota bacterium]NIU35398.1 DUF819 family protein [Gemmatimonadota bacterium]